VSKDEIRYDIDVLTQKIAAMKGTSDPAVWAPLLDTDGRELAEWKARHKEAVDEITALRDQLGG